MDPVSIINALTAAAEAGMQLYSDYQQGKTILSATDAQSVHEALLKAEATTAALRQQVDAALEAAAKT